MHWHPQIMVQSFSTNTSNRKENKIATFGNQRDKFTNCYFLIYTNSCYAITWAAQCRSLWTPACLGENSKRAHYIKNSYHFAIYPYALGAVVVVIVRLLYLQLPMQSVYITTTVVSSNRNHDDMYLTQHYVIKFVSDLIQVGGVRRVLRIHPLIKLTDVTS